MGAFGCCAELPISANSTLRGLASAQLAPSENVKCGQKVPRSRAREGGEEKGRERDSARARVRAKGKTESERMCNHLRLFSQVDLSCIYCCTRDQRFEPTPDSKHNPKTTTFCHPISLLHKPSPHSLSPLLQINPPPLIELRNPPPPPKPQSRPTLFFVEEPQRVDQLYLLLGHRPTPPQTLAPPESSYTYPAPNTPAPFVHYPRPSKRCSTRSSTRGHAPIFASIF
jgi:hypothetical protein